MGNTCKPMAVSFQCMTKSTTKKKKNPTFSTHFYSGVWLLVWSLSPPFDSPFSSPYHLYFLPPTSLFNPILWISVGVLGCGEHLGNRVPPRSVSLLLNPPFFSSCSSLSLSSSPLLHVTLWTFLGVPHCENLFTINLEALLSVLYGWRSLEATGKIRLKSRGKRLKPKTWEHQRTPDYREH